MRADNVAFDHTPKYGEPNKLMLPLIAGGIVLLIIASAAFVYMTVISPPQPQSPVFIPDVTITPMPTASPEPTVAPTATPAPTLPPTPTPGGDYPNASGLTYLWDVENNTYRVVTPTPEPQLMMTLEEARALGYDGSTTIEDFLYNHNVAAGLIHPKPQLSLELLNEKNETWDWQREIIEKPSEGEKTYISGYVKINNLADTAYQGDIDIVVNGSLIYANGRTDNQRAIFTEPVSIAPHNYNKIWKCWEVWGNFSTGVYEVFIELREKEYGSTIYSMRISPSHAYMDDNGNKYF